MIAACGRGARALVNAASSRIGPSRLVGPSARPPLGIDGVDVFGFHDSGHCDEQVQLGEADQDVGRGSGDLDRVGGVDDHGLDTGCPAAICLSRSVRRPPTITRLPAA